MKNTVLLLSVGFFIGKAYSRYSMRKREQTIAQRTTKSLKNLDLSVDEISNHLQYVLKK